jgi:hypothetical protein
MSKLDQLTEVQKQRLRQHAAKAQAVALPIVRYVDGRFKIGSSAGVVDVTDADYIAVTDKIAAVWKLFQNGGVDELTRVYVLDDGVPKRPDGYNDRDQWKKDSKGKPNDPLSMQYEMPLITADDGRVVMFQASTILTKAIIGRLLDDFVATMRRPCVTLTVEPNPDNKNQMVPDFTITSHSDDDSDVPGLPAAGSSAPVKEESKPLPAKDAMDDAIPF